MAPRVRMAKMRRTRIISTASLALLLLTVSMSGFVTVPTRAQAVGSSGCATSPSVRPNANEPVLFDQFVGPLVELATRRRQAEIAADPEVQHRIDASLNDHRLNVAVLGYGEEHGQTY